MFDAPELLTVTDNISSESGSNKQSMNPRQVRKILTRGGSNKSWLRRALRNEVISTYSVTFLYRELCTPKTSAVQRIGEYNRLKYAQYGSLAADLRNLKWQPKLVSKVVLESDWAECISRQGHFPKTNNKLISGVHRPHVRMLNPSPFDRRSPWSLVWACHMPV